MIKPHPSITRAWPAEKINLTLRQDYGRITKEPIPEDMKRLLDALK